MLKRTRFIFGLLAVIMTLSMLGGFVLPTSAGDVEEATLVSVQNATAADTADDAPQNYRIDTIEELIYASQNPSFYGAGDTIFLMADLDLNQYNGEFITDFYNFGKNTGGSTHFKANFDGMGHTIYNYTETLPFFSGTLDSTVRNLIFEGANVNSGTNYGAVVARTTEYGATLDNVHVRNSNVTTEKENFAGVLVALINGTNDKSNKYLTLRNCSVNNTHIVCNYNGAASKMSLFIGAFQTAACLKVENCMAVNSSVSGLTPTNNISGLLVGEVGHNSRAVTVGDFSRKIQGTTAQFENIGTYNCEFKNYGTGSTSYAAIAGLKQDGTITADHIYAFNTMRSSEAGLNTATVPMENLFYAYTRYGVLNLTNCLTNAETTYQLQYDAYDAEAVDVELPDEFKTEDTSLENLIQQMNGSLGESHLQWTLDETNLPITTYFDDALFTPGDVNNDGTVDILDALVTLRILSGDTYKGELEERAMFVAGNTTVTTEDAALILKKAAGQDVLLLAAPTDETIVINKETGSYCFESSLTYAKTTVKVLSQNILHGKSNIGPFIDGVDMNNGTLRRERMKTLVQSYDADIIALQEYRQQAWFDKFENEILPATDYDNYIVSRADPARATLSGAYNLGIQNGAHTYETAYQPDERLAIFWKKGEEGFELVTDENGDAVQGIFWFSETPDESSPSFGTENNVLSTYGKGSYADVYVDNRARITIWVKLRDNQTGLEFYYFNFHFPNTSDTAARTVEVKSAQLMASKVEYICQTYGDAPVLLGGDMNTDYYIDADWPALYEMAKNFSDVGASMGDLQGTFPGFGSKVSQDGSIGNRIDFLFTRNGDGTTVAKYEVAAKTFDADGNMINGFGEYNADWETMDNTPPSSSSEDVEQDEEETTESSTSYVYKFNNYYASDHFGLYGEFEITNQLATSSALTLNTPNTATIETENDLPITLALTGLDDDNTCSPGDELTATIALKEGANLSSLPLTLTYDPMVLELITNAETALMTCEQKETSGGTVTAAFYSEDNITAGGTLLTAKFKAINTDAVKDSKVTASIAPIFDSAYYATRYDSNGIPYAVDYSSESISSTFDSYAVIAQNTTTGANYFDLTTALNEAAENETVVLLQDTEVSEIVVNTGSTFDLNGHVLKTDTVLSYGDIMDGAENVGGVQIPVNTEENENMILQSTNAQLPLYDQANGCYRFFACSVESAGYKNGTNTSVKFGYYLKFEKEEAYTLLKNGADTTGMTFSVDLTWDNLGKIIQYNFSSNTVATMANYWLNGSTGVALTLTVTGLENITNQTLVTTPVARSIDVSITTETANSYKVPLLAIDGTVDSDWG